MSQKERIKAFLTAIFGIFGFTLINYQKINLLQGIGIIIGLFFLLAVLYLIAKRIIKNLNKLSVFARLFS